MNFGKIKQKEKEGNNNEEKTIHTGVQDKTVTKQCEILEYNRNSAYYKPKLSGSMQLEIEEYLKSRIDYWHTKMCFNPRHRGKE